jgi:Right handed beta helix region
VNRSQLLRLSRGAIAPVISASALLIVIAGLASDRAFAASTLGVGCGAGSFPTIQGAVDAAGAGDTVQVCAGSYAEQVTIPAAKTGLTLRSQPAAAATIQAPASLPPTQSSALVHVDGATGVTIDGFMISGPGTGSCGTIGYGVLVDGGGSATVSSNHVADIRDSSLSGCQSGVGVAAGCCLTGPASSGTLVATGNTIDGYQKSGIDIRGAGSAGTLTRNIIRGAGPTTRIAQNAIQISRSASATVTGNTISGSVFAPQPLATGIVAIGPVGNLAIAGNILVGNDYGIWVFNASATTTVSGNATTAGFYGIVVGLSRNVLVEKNLSDRAATAGIRAAEDASGNTFRNNVATGVDQPGHDCLDESTGSLTAGTANTWTNNVGDTRSPEGICSSPPVIVDPPPVIVIPPSGGPGPGGPPAEEVGDRVITRMRRNKLRSCVIEVRTLGPSRVLVARGVARAPAKGTGRLVVRIRVKPRGRTLLSKNFGGVTVNVRALCRSSSNTLHGAVRTVRAVLLIEHALTPPGSWVPDQPVLTAAGESFMQHLRHRMVAVRFIRCDGYTATWPSSSADPPTLSLQRARVVCTSLRRGGAKARIKLVPHGLNDPIASNSTEAGRSVHRRVFVTIVHLRVFKS